MPHDIAAVRKLEAEVKRLRQTEADLNDDNVRLREEKAEWEWALAELKNAQQRITELEQALAEVAEIGRVMERELGDRRRDA